MGYLELEAAIRADFGKEMAKLSQDCAAEVARIGEESRQAGMQAADRIVGQAGRKAVLTRRQIAGMASHEAMLRVNTEKNRLIEAVFADARAAILSASDKEKSDFLHTLARDGDTLPGKKRILIDRNHFKLLHGLKGIETVESEIGDFGIVIESHDGLMRIDNRMDSLLENARAGLRPQVNRILFG